MPIKAHKGGEKFAAAARGQAILHLSFKRTSECKAALADDDAAVPVALMLHRDQRRLFEENFASAHGSRGEDPSAAPRRLSLLEAIRASDEDRHRADGAE
eukprot:4741034-Pleurochrysis_carterae.AAC.3